MTMKEVMGLIEFPGLSPVDSCKWWGLGGLG